MPLSRSKLEIATITGKDVEKAIRLLKRTIKTQNPYNPRVKREYNKNVKTIQARKRYHYGKILDNLEAEFRTNTGVQWEIQMLLDRVVKDYVFSHSNGNATVEM